MAITSKDEADATITQVKRFRNVSDPNAQIVNMSDNDFRNIWKYTHKDLIGVRLILKI